MTILHLDVESRSTVDLKKSGAPAYWQDPVTDVICACFAKDDGPVETWRRGDPVPALIVQAVAEGWLIYAHNAAFEWWAWITTLGPRYGWPVPEPRNLRCTAAMAAAMALPRSLDAVSRVLKLDHQKDGEGHTLMLQMCKPRRIEHGEPVWWEDEERLGRLAAYCAADVEAEREVGKRVRPLQPEEQELWFLDREINDRGVRIDIPSIKRAREIINGALELLHRELKSLTDYRVKKVTNAAPLAEWLAERGVDLEVVDKKAKAAPDADAAKPVMRLSVDKARITKALKHDYDRATRRVLTIRQEAARSSVAKLTSFLDHVSPDGRVRENVMFCGAGTGRWAARGVQLHNLLRPAFEYETIERALACLGDPEPLEWLQLVGSPIDIIASCLRSLIVAEPGNELVFGDYANIEGRVLAWLAGEEWKLDAFRAYDAGTGPNIYLLAAARIFGVDVSTLTKDSPEYQPGKVGELSLGFGGGVGAYQAMAANYNVEVEDAAADQIKKDWRAAQQQTVRFWGELEDAAFQAVLEPGTPVWAGELQRRGEAPRQGKIAFLCRQGVLWMQLPSGRRLAYITPTIGPRTMPWKDDEGKPVVRDVVKYMAEDPVTHRWSVQAGWGGLWAENATQATARDVMAAAMLRMARRGWPLVLTVHDEIVAEARIGAIPPEVFREEMVRPLAWYAGLPLAATVLAGPRYRKGA